MSDVQASPGLHAPATRPTPRMAVPFLLLGAVGLLNLVLPPYHARPVHLVLIAVMVPVILWLHRVSMRRAERSWVDLAAPLAMFPLIVVLRDATGGADSGLAPLVAVPVFWLAVFGTRRDVFVGAGLVAFTFLLPMVMVGAPEYPFEEWRRAALWSGVALVIAPVVQHVVRRLAVESNRAREVATRLEGIMRGATLSSLVTTDVDGRITTYGVGAELQTGYVAADVQGEPLTALWFLDDEIEAVASELEVHAGFAVLARLAHLRAPSRIWTIRRGDGGTAFVRLAVTELRDDRDLVRGYLCVAIDATDATRAERALVQAEQRWRVLMDHLPGTTVITVEEGTGVTVVTGAEDLAHRLRDAPGRRLQDLVDRDAPGTMDRMLEAAFAGEEVPPVYANVGEAEHQFVASALPERRGRRQAIVVARDVSVERRRQRSLTVAKARAERLFDDAPQGIALLRPDGTVLRVNPALTAMFGSGLEGRPLDALSDDPEDLAISLHLTRVRDAPDQRAETQWSVRDAQGEVIHVVLVSTMLKGVGDGEDQILTNVVDVSERYRYERQLAFLAEHDPLTGLANRRRFDQELARHVDHVRRYGPRGAVLMLDLDHFKEVNDTLGHAIGDELLVDVAALLMDRMRSTDLVARLGGDEFAVLLPEADQKSAELVAASIVERISEQVSRMGDARRGVTVSIGGVVVDASHLSASDVLSAADSAMYVAKHSGRNRFTFLTVNDRDA